MAESTGLLGLTAETPDKVRPMITQALKHNGPALVDAIVGRRELSMPPTITLEQMTGISLFMLKAVFSGRGDKRTKTSSRHPSDELGSSQSRTNSGTQISVATAAPPLHPQPATR